MWRRYQILFLLFSAATEASDGINGQLVDELLLEELKQSSGGLFPPSWAYSNEGGVIKYAEIDLIGDERREIVYSRSTGGLNHDSGEWDYDIYFQPVGEDQFVRLEGEVFPEKFHKKEAGESLFIDATEGRNFATGSERAFTKKLSIQEVSPEGIKTHIYIIDNDSNNDHVKMWQAALLKHEEASISVMRDLGFSIKNPGFKWISLKDYLLGKEWNDYNAGDWVALTEFEAEGVTWLVPDGSISDSFLDVARQVRKLHNHNTLGVKWESIDFPDGYFLPKYAYRLALEKSLRGGSGSDSNAHNEKMAGGKGSSHLAERTPATAPNVQNEQENVQTKKLTSLPWIIAGVVVFGTLVLVVRTFSRNRASE